jgi:hypothetical protein
MQQFMQSYTPTGAQSLRWCASLLHRRMPEPTLNDDTVEDLRSRVGNLAIEVDGAEDLDPELQRFISVRLWDIFEALSSYGQRGIRGVEEATEKLIGSVAVRKDMWARMPGAWLNMVVNVTSLIASAVSIATGAPQLTDGSDAVHQEQQLIVNIYQESTGQEMPEITSHDQAREHEILEGEIVEDEPRR